MFEKDLEENRELRKKIMDKKHRDKGKRKRHGEEVRQLLQWQVLSRYSLVANSFLLIASDPPMLMLGGRGGDVVRYSVPAVMCWH